MKTNSKAGLTLIEIVLTVAIAATIAAISIPVVMTALRKSYDDETRGEMTAMVESIDLYVRDVGEFPLDLSELIVEPDEAPDGWSGPYTWSGLNLDGFTQELRDGWATPYVLFEREEYPDRRFLRSYGPDKVSNNGSGDDITVQVDMGPWRREITRRELAVLNRAIGKYNKTHLPHDPLPSDIDDVVDALQGSDYLPDGDEYLADAWGTPYIPGPEPVQEVYVGGNALGGGWPGDDDDDGGGGPDGLPGDDDDDDDGGLPGDDDDGGLPGDDDDGGLPGDDDDDGGLPGDDDDGGGGDGDGDGERFLLCHIPPGNPDAQHTLSVGPNAVAAHLDHGDRLGQCCPISIDFEYEDDGSTILVDGQSVSSPPEFGRTVSISGTGPNFGPAIFDTTIGGPNDPGRDSDLLVDLGNALILQENNTQSVPGIFDYPDDDAGGGFLIFEFFEYVEVSTITLIDVDDGGVGQAVHLINADGEERYFECPGGWTRDIASQGPPGFGVLDLTTLADQPGYVTNSWAIETANFDPEKVVRIEVNFAGSGAVASISICPKGEIVEGDEACLSNIWSTNHDDWAAAGFDPTDMLSSVFMIPESLASCSPGLSETSLGDALLMTGFTGTCGNARLLLREATAALLNAGHPNVNFPLAVEDLIALVDDALAAGNAGALGQAATNLQGLNALGNCPFGN